MPDSTNLQTLVDERSVIRGLSLFARIADAKTFHELGDVFAEDLTFDYGSGRVEHGLAALGELMSEARWATNTGDPRILSPDGVLG